MTYTTINQRQLNLFLLIREYTEEELTLDVQEICTCLKCYVPSFRESNYSNCPLIYKDIKALNASPEIDAIIVTDNNNFHIANEQEAKEYIKKTKIKALKVLKEHWSLLKKLESNHQLTFNEEIDLRTIELFSRDMELVKNINEDEDLLKGIGGSK